LNFVLWGSRGKNGKPTSTASGHQARLYKRKTCHRFCEVRVTPACTRLAKPPHAERMAGDHRFVAFRRLPRLTGTRHSHTRERPSKKSRKQSNP
jgi:hypothetical protein